MSVTRSLLAAALISAAFTGVAFARNDVFTVKFEAPTQETRVITQNTLDGVRFQWGAQFNRMVQNTEDSNAGWARYPSPGLPRRMFSSRTTSAAPTRGPIRVSAI